MSEQKVYKCFKSDFSELEKKINRITKKLDKHNLKWRFEVISETVEEVSVIDYRNLDNIRLWQFHPKNLGKTAVEVVNYTFDMESLKLGEYEVLAVLEHNQIENSEENIIHVIKQEENISIPLKYRTIKSHCQHCKSDRRRNKTVLLINSENEIIQVGSTCIKEYTGIDGLDIIKNYQDIHDICLEELNLDYEKSGSYLKFNKTIDYLTACIQLIKTVGYKKEGNPTKYKALDILQDKELDKQYLPIAEKVIEYFKSQDYPEYQTFLNNIKLYLSNEYTKANGLIAYAYLAYQKELEKEEQKRKEVEGKANSEYVGTIGEKLEIELTLKKYITYETQWGISKIYLFEDGKGNVYKWNSAKYIEAEEGNNLKLKGTIKDHSEYNGTKQTVLTRCKVIA